MGVPSYSLTSPSHPSIHLLQLSLVLEWVVCLEYDIHSCVGSFHIVVIQMFNVWFSLFLKLHPILMLLAILRKCVPLLSLLYLKFAGSGNFYFVPLSHCRALRLRKALGGGLRQSGVLAAPGIIALEVMSQRLHEDHAQAKRLSEGR